MAEHTVSESLAMPIWVADPSLQKCKPLSCKILFSDVLIDMLSCASLCFVERSLRIVQRVREVGVQLLTGTSSPYCSASISYIYPREWAQCLPSWPAMALQRRASA